MLTYSPFHQIWELRSVSLTELQYCFVEAMNLICSRLYCCCRILQCKFKPKPLKLSHEIQQQSRWINSFESHKPILLHKTGYHESIKSWGKLGESLMKVSETDNGKKTIEVSWEKCANFETIAIEYNLFVPPIPTVYRHNLQIDLRLYWWGSTLSAAILIARFPSCLHSTFAFDPNVTPVRSSLGNLKALLRFKKLEKQKLHIAKRKTDALDLTQIST